MKNVRLFILFLTYAMGGAALAQTSVETADQCTRWSIHVGFTLKPIKERRTECETTEIRCLRVRINGKLSCESIDTLHEMNVAYFEPSQSKNRCFDHQKYNANVVMGKRNPEDGAWADCK